ncbi:MAG: hypothetical protein RLY31_1348 [Bacteroidota bacterium]|jgi:hypothetical protein
MNPLLLLFLLTCCLAAERADAQKFLQLEKLHSLKTKKYYPGDEITFRLGNGQWYTRTIDDLSYDQQSVLFANGFTRVDSILDFRSFSPARWSRPIGNQLLNFAIAWVVFSTIDEALSDQPFRQVPRNVISIPLVSAGTGLALKHTFRRRTYPLVRPNRNRPAPWRLRVLDLTVN